VQYLSWFDYVVIVAYFCTLVGLGLYLKRLASASIEDYFVGGRKLPWWALGISGMASYLDIAGTMIITSFLFMLGPRGLFVEFRGGAVLALCFMMLWSGKWHRRSQVLTAAEWMVFRFGDGPGGRFAQLAKVIGGIISTVGMLAYLIKAVGLFLSTFLPFSPLVCAIILVGIASIYTMVSGFYGVVFTDMFQSVVILIAVVTISAMAMMKVADVGSLSEVAVAVTGNEQWMSSVPHWKTEMPDGYEQYSSLFMFAFFYLMRNVFYGFGEGADPKWFGARSDAECSKMTFLWTWLMMFRWPMMMGFAVLGIFLVRDLFPDQQVLVDSAALIKAHYPEITQPDWAGVLSGIVNTPDQYPKELVEGLRNLHGEDWVNRVKLVSFYGNVNPERILPAVLLYSIPVGFRGLLLIALLAASMSTFDSTVNMTTGFWTRDIYQKYLRPKATTKELIYSSWIFIATLVVVAFVLAVWVKNINDIWGWIIMGLGGGMLVPTFVRLYWWRFNGSGFACGMAFGITGAVVQRLLFPETDERVQFLILTGVGFVGSVIGTYLSKPTDPEVLKNFYVKTRPFGLWGPLVHHLSDEQQTAMRAEHKRDLFAIPFALTWHITLFMLPMQFVIKEWRSFFITLVIFSTALTGLYFVWLRYQRDETYTS